MKHIEQSVVERTVESLTVILALWKIVSNKEIKGDERHREPLKATIKSADDENLQLLKDISATAVKMRGLQGKNTSP